MSPQKYPAKAVLECFWETSEKYDWQNNIHRHRFCV